MKTNFGVVGLGFIFSRHVDAIEANKGRITWGCDIDGDKADKLPQSAKFSQDYRTCKDADHITVLTPNYLHQEIAMHYAKLGKTVLIEKPPAISLENLQTLAEYEKIYTVLQLRHHPDLIKVKAKIDPERKYQVEMKILIHRDDWYFDSWKVDEQKSGGILYNIGIHYFDALAFLFGEVTNTKTTDLRQYQAAGLIEFSNAIVDWQLSLKAPISNQKRLLIVDGHRLNLTQKFENLHTKVYKELLAGRGVHVGQCKKTLQLIEALKHI